MLAVGARYLQEGIMRLVSRFFRDERGSVVFFVIGAFLMLLLFVGMATDFGSVLRYQRAMQNAYDAGVLAGAQDLRSTTRVATATAQTYTARDLTENHFQVNNFQGAWQYQAQTQDANGNASGVNPVRLWASIQTTVPLFFLKPVRPSLMVAVQCAAQRVPVLTTGMRPVEMDSAVFEHPAYGLPSIETWGCRRMPEHLGDEVRETRRASSECGCRRPSPSQDDGCGTH
jgi:Flp pilus assembly protein TadG